jgi:hypothetical protein
MDTYCIEILQGLNTQISSKSITFNPNTPIYAYAGAGLSMNAGLPGWFQMAISLHSFMQVFEKANLPDFTLQNELELSKFFQDFIEEKSQAPGDNCYLLSPTSNDNRLFGRTVALNLLFRCRGGFFDGQNFIDSAEVFCRAGTEPKAEDLSVHSALWRAGVHGIITTNYDILLERAYSFFNHPGGLRTYRYDASFLRFILSTPRFIVKIHGDINDLGSMILDPEMAWKKSTYLNGRMGFEVKKLYSNIREAGALVFLGVGFRDRTICELQQYWKQIRKSKGIGFAVFFESEIKKTVEQWKRMGYAEDLFDDVIFFIVDDRNLTDNNLKGFVIQKSATNLLDRLEHAGRGLVHRPRWDEASKIHRFLYRKT